MKEHDCDTIIQLIEINQLFKCKKSGPTDKNNIPTQNRIEKLFIVKDDNSNEY